MAAIAAIAGPVEAKTISGTRDGVTFTASNTVIGQSSTATVAGGGNPIYLAQAAQYRSTVGLRMNYGADGNFVCSGSLSANRSSIITAGHCVTIFDRAPNSVTAFFYNGNPADASVYGAGSPGVTTVGVSRVYVNPLYTGNVIDDHDIAVLRLAGPAPVFANGYNLYTGTDLTGLDFNFAGYGRRSLAGGSGGTDPAFGLGTGRLRQGDNRFDFRLGDSDFGGLFTPDFFGEAPGASLDYSYLADFDNGLAMNDASCGLAGFAGVALSAKYCNLGVGALEAKTAGGDSGGPQFIDGKLASVTSYGLSFGTFFSPGDIDNNLNDTFGEFAGFVPIYHNLDFLASSVPEPANWAMLIAGFGLTGAAMRRHRKLVAAHI
ncbi:MAG: PEPxxWA-CTERM sorting domain-containing protein [Sandarakinorhabdus sp.]|nr:PEPxxWA-CTERM sorting domain-containing protein [Sandarakinorhabdus sp.]